MPKRLAILGVGLLGGSIGLAARRAIRDCRIVGYGHRQASLDKAMAMNCVHEGTVDAAEAARDAELVVLCTPVGTFGRILDEIAPALTDGCIVTDVGSTKASVVREASRLLPKTVHFVGSHPMAGSEKRGVEFARADLFAGALCITTPDESTDPGALETVESFWQSLDMRVTRLPPVEHDRRLADVSHLPHALAAALVSMQDDRSFPLSGKGFADTTRVAAGDAGLWRDILLDNRDNVIASIERLSGELARLANHLRSGNSDAVTSWLENAARKRESL